jgi:hypothetical protein
MILSILQTLLQLLLNSGYVELLDFPILAAAKKQTLATVVSPPKPIPTAFMDELEAMLKNTLGPLGSVLLEDAADNIGSEIDAMNSKNATAWLNALIPSERKERFAQELEVLQKST